MAETRVAFVTDRIGVTETFSIPILSATAKRGGHPVTLIEYDRDPRAAIAKAKAFKPDVLAYSVMSPDADKALGANRVLKRETGAYSVFGGVHPTFFPDYLAEDGVDAICVGEGDHAFRDLLDAFGTSAMYDTTNMHFRENGQIRRNPLTRLVDNLDELPFPDKEIIYGASYFLQKLPIRAFFASRGCPYKCTYCFNHSFNEMYRGLGKTVRFKSVGYVLEEIKRVLARRPATFLKFHDDVFGIKKEWLAEFAERYPREVGLPFLVLVRPNMVDDDYCRKLKEAGCHSVCIAIEAGNDDIRNTVMLRKMSDQLIYEAFDTLRRHGLRTYCLNMLGLPGETEETFVETLHMNQTCKVDYADASIFQPYPGVHITQYAIDHGYLDGQQASWGGQYSESVLNFPPALKKRLHAYQIMFPLLVDQPWLERWFEWIVTINGTRAGKALLGMVYRFTYGWMLQRRIYPVRVPLHLKAWAALTLLFSKHRN